jgi:predicted RNA binding protein YcfA (HicA-like mRNA interferase family)
VAPRDMVLECVLRGPFRASIRFGDLCDLLRRMGFAERIRGSHHIFTKHGVEEIVNLQPSGAFAKPYQVRQVRKIILRYMLGGEE